MNTAPACDSGHWPCRFRACPHNLASVARQHWVEASWCMLVVLRAYPNGASLDDVGAELGFSRERIRQLENHAFELIRARGELDCWDSWESSQFDELSCPWL
jgi:hypothetical protein